MSIETLNARNQFRGKIIALLDDGVMSEVEVETANGIVTSVVTSRSVKELNLVIGTEVVALTKATEVSLAKL